MRQTVTGHSWSRGCLESAGPTARGTVVRRSRAALVAGLAAALVVTASARRASAQWVIESKDGQTNIKIGFLLQPQMELLETADNTETSKNLFLRRFRILFGGKLSEKWTFFFETDSPNIGRSVPGSSNPTGAKDTSTIFMQDAFVTYDYSTAFKIDAGLILMPLSHNHLQSAATLLPVDYGPYTFLESTVMGERVGRDYGVEARGYPLDQHLEYRVGVFSGNRGVVASNPLRVVARVVYDPFAADTGFFYGGTFQGSKRIVGLGASIDRQKEYGVYNADAFVEEPLFGGEQGVTLQFDWMRFDGGTFLTALPKQDTYLVEGAYHFGKAKFSPLVQYAWRSFANPVNPNTNSLQAGVAWWMKGHNRNLKVTGGRLHTDGKPDQTQVLAQLQIFFY